MDAGKRTTEVTVRLRLDPIPFEQAAAAVREMADGFAKLAANIRAIEDRYEQRKADDA